jgi:uncharacterized protein YbaR (Trm112 family)
MREIHAMLDAELLEILVCPEDHSALRVADADLIGKINAAIAAGTLKNRAGQKVDEAIDSGLIRADGKYLYIVRDDIPVMLIDEAIPLSQLA